MFLKQFLVIAVFNLILLSGFSQEVVVPLTDNPALAGYKNKVAHLKMAEIEDTLQLPFFDEFSGIGYPYPKQSLWLDSFVYINDTYSVNPMSIGVATFDVLDQYGNIYDNASNIPFNADVLTSKPINLSYPASSNIYLSFYYQPQGLGYFPEARDSLMVDFYNPASKKWWNIWKIGGTTLHPFKAVIIPVVADSFLVKGFQFRIRNKGSILNDRDDPGKMGVSDQWHIDYVKLDANRTDHDTIMRDVAFSKPLNTLLQDNFTKVFLTSMPWKQFQVAFAKVMRKDIDITYKNNDTIGHKPERYFRIRDLKGDFDTLIYSGNENISPKEEYHFATNIEYPFFTSETESASFEVQSYLETEPYDIKMNDTTRFNQVFSNYFSYDDGSPEYGYGLSGQGTINSMVACRFTSYFADTLTAVRIYFNSTLNELNKGYNFNISVWSGSTNGPGTRIYKGSSQTPSELGKYKTYLLDTAIIVNGDFYVGWQQPTEDFLNIGLDRNNNSMDGVYYNTGYWNKATKVSFGSLMIRPVFGSKGLISGTPEEIPETKAFRIYPNPCPDILNIEPATEIKGTLSATLINMTGRILLQSNVSNGTINLEELPVGLYMLILTEDGKPVYKGKIIVQH